MDTSKLTEAEVHAACASIAAEGVRPTALTLLDNLGRGSIATITQYLSSWNASDEAKVFETEVLLTALELSPELIKDGEDLLKKMWSIAKEVAKEELNIQRDPLEHVELSSHPKIEEVFKFSEAQSLKIEHLEDILSELKAELAEEQNNHVKTVAQLNDAEKANVQLLEKFLRKKYVREGIVGISFLDNGIAIAVSRFSKDNKRILVHCEFIDGKKEEYLQGRLSELVVQHNLAGYDCHLVLNPDNYRRVDIEAPDVDEKEMNEAIRRKVHDFFDFPVDKAIVYYYQSSMYGRRHAHMSYVKTLNVIASPIDTLTKLIEKCTRVGLQLNVIDIQETSIRNLAVHMPENESGVVLLHMQAFSSTLLIQKEGTIYVFRTLDFGYENLGLSEPFADDNSPSAHAHNRLALEIQRSLSYVESYYGIPPISIVAVIPLPENTHNLLDGLTRNLGSDIAFQVLDMSAFIDCRMLPDNQTQSFCAPVIGATLFYEIPPPRSSLIKLMLMDLEARKK